MACWEESLITHGCEAQRDERLWNNHMKLDSPIPTDKEDSGPER